MRAEQSAAGEGAIPENPSPGSLGDVLPQQSGSAADGSIGPARRGRADTRLTPKALVAPHAGYIYSGGVAAAAFATLRGSAETIKRVVLIGPAHYVHVPGIASPTVDAFEIPLGHVPVDLAALGTLADLDFVVTANGPHVPEHCLEVLPFLQSALASFQIVPLVVGDALPHDVAGALRRLCGGPETLIVVSCDLSHYHPYEVAQRLDADTANAIEHGDWPDAGRDRTLGQVSSPHNPPTVIFARAIGVAEIALKDSNWRSANSGG